MAALNKQGHVIYSGWMTKSPPEWKLQHRKFIRPRWRQRFFVLLKPSGSLPDQYELNYYSDTSCRNKRGSIDLEQCEQIIESLDSEQFSYLLAIKTIYKSRERVYYLATKTEEEMSTWVQYLCRVCGLKQEESPTDIPEQKKNATPAPTAGLYPKPSANPPIQSQPTPGGAQAAKSQNHNAAQRSATARSPQTQQPQPQPPPPPHEGVSKSSSESYIPLTSCQTGPSVRSAHPPAYLRRESSDSVPDEPAPPPPTKDGRERRDRDSNGCKHEVYDVPPRTFSTLDELYQVPPPRSVAVGSTDSHHTSIAQSIAYDEPPSRGGSATPRSSISDSGARPVTPQEPYDIPPPRPTSTSTSSSLELPPDRPPRPSVYQNLPKDLKNSLNVVPSAPKIVEKPVNVDRYDIPQSNPMSIGDLAGVSPPAPCLQTTTTRHAYINAAPGVVPAASAMDEAYIPMDSAASAPPHGGVYTDMNSAASGRRDTMMSDGRASEVYQYPPSNPRPVESSPPPPVVPPRPAPRSALNNAPADQSDLYTIWSSGRTKSFKRNLNSANSSSSGSRSTTASSQSSRHAVPAPRPVESSSDEDDRMQTSPLDTTFSPQNWRTVPPPPQEKEEKELKYLDLDLDNMPDEPSGGRQLASTSVAPTEYREIDFVKTQALQDVKKLMQDGHRAQEDH